MDEVIAQIDDMQSQVDDLSTTQQDTDLNISQMQDTIDQTAGQLSAPLSPNTVSLIMEQFPRGSVTLSGGFATVYNPLISFNSIILMGRIGGLLLTDKNNIGFYPTPTLTSLINGQFTITTCSGDNATINYLILQQSV